MPAYSNAIIMISSVCGVLARRPPIARYEKAGENNSRIIWCACLFFLSVGLSFNFGSGAVTPHGLLLLLGFMVTMVLMPIELIVHRFRELHCRFMDKSHYVIYYSLSQIIHCDYVVTVGMCSMLAWKHVQVDRLITHLLYRLSNRYRVQIVKCYMMGMGKGMTYTDQGSQQIMTSMKVPPAWDPAWEETRECFV